MELTKESLKLSKESQKFIEEHPSGKMEDLPQEMKDQFCNIVQEFKKHISKGLLKEEK